tara:strand:- start:589 stop:741 length:153 start_codon:yes stop_codon:yes gene_type:complete
MSRYFDQQTQLAKSEQKQTDNFLSSLFFTSQKKKQCSTQANPMQSNWQGK